MKKSEEERKAESRAYYWKNRDIILEKARKEADECKKRRAEQKKKKTTSLQFYTEWQKQLLERLKAGDLDDWLVTALKLLSDQINSIIDKLNGK
jgi:hypothetical protein